MRDLSDRPAGSFMIAKGFIPGVGTRSFAIMNASPYCVSAGIPGPVRLANPMDCMITGRNGCLSTETARDHEKDRAGGWELGGFGDAAWRRGRGRGLGRKEPGD